MMEHDARFVALMSPTRQLCAAMCLVNSCCFDFCNVFLSPSHVLQIRYEFLLHYDSLCDALVLFLKRFTSISDDALVVDFTLGGIPVCIDFVAVALGVASSRLLELLTQPNCSSGDLPVRPRSITVNTAKKLGLAARLLLRQCQSHPSGDLIANASFRKRSLHDKKYSFRFNRLKKMLRTRVVLPKLDSLTRCAACTALKHHMRYDPTFADRTAAALNLVGHLGLIECERVALSSVGCESRLDPQLVQVIKTDGMSSARTKLPLLQRRAKSQTDSLRLTMGVSAVQYPVSGPAQYSNCIIIDVAKRYGSSSNVVCSHVLSGLLKLPCLPALLCIVLDNCASNKSDVFLGFLAILLERLPIGAISVLYQRVGHTHNSVDAVFGVIAKSLTKADISNPTEFTDHVRSMKCIDSVESNYPVYNFGPLKAEMNPCVNRASYHQIQLHKHASGAIHFGVAKYIEELGLGDIDGTGAKSAPLFRSAFDVSTFEPAQIVPNSETATKEFEAYMKASGSLLTPDDVDAFRNSLLPPPTEDFPSLIRKLLQKPSAPVSALPVPNETLTQFLSRRNYKITDIPRPLRFSCY